LRRRGIQAVIPERDDQIANRKRRGAKGGRPVTYDTEAYKRRNVVERGRKVKHDSKVIIYNNIEDLAEKRRGKAVHHAVTKIYDAQLFKEIVDEQSSRASRRARPTLSPARARRRRPRSWPRRAGSPRA
jgi:hypothetical protein